MPARAAIEPFREIAEFTYDWESWIDRGGTPRWVNAAVERITGYTVAECLAMVDYPRPLVHPLDQGLVARVDDEARRGGSGNDLEFRIVRKDGATRWVAISFQPLRNGAGEPLGYRTSVRDIDERKRMEQELHEMRKRAEAAATARAELLANVSHELRSPVHCIAGFAELLLAGALEGGQRRYAEIIQDQCQSMLRQVEDLLGLAAIEAGGVQLSREPFDLAALAERLVASLGPTAHARDITLTCDVPAGPHWVEGDGQRLRQVLRNLLDNALKFTDEGEVRLVVRGAEDDVHFEVRDTGIGMAQADVERLLEPFQQGDTRTRRRHGGAGLGLAISQRLVRAMGGSLEVETAQGRGTCVSFTLPLPRAEPGAQRESLGELTLGSHGVALVVDDSAAARELLCEMLALVGWRAVEAESGEAAQRVAAECEPDMVLLDYQMPGADGAETALALRKLLAARRPTQRVPIVLLTANVFAREQLSAARGAVDAIVSKPLSRATLARLLRNAGSPSHPPPPLGGPLDPAVVRDLIETRGRDGAPLLARLLPRVCAEVDAALVALNDPDRSTAARAAHALAGQAALVGAQGLSDRARALELALSDGDGAVEPDELRALSEGWRDARTLLEARLSG